MKRLKYILCMGTMCGLFACQSDELHTATDDNRRIYLMAEVENASVESRVPYELTAPSLDKPLSVDVWASTIPNLFVAGTADGSNGTVSLHTTARFTNSQEQLLDAVIYPKENTVYFVGMHPRDWSTTDGTSATYTFDGKNDVMFAPQIEGKYAKNAEPKDWPTLTFKHLLTWLRIEMVAESEAVRDAWGKVTGMSIKSKNQVTVDLSSPYVDKKHDGTDTTVKFSGETDMNFYQTGTDDKFPEDKGYTLKGPQYAGNDESYIEEVAYVLCAPVNATASEVVNGIEVLSSEYTITVTTEKRTANVNIDLKNAADTYFNQTTMDRQFTLLLRFKSGDNISVSAEITDWTNGGIGVGEFDENSFNSGT